MESLHVFQWVTVISNFIVYLSLSSVLNYFFAYITNALFMIYFLYLLMVSFLFFHRLLFLLHAFFSFSKSFSCNLFFYKNYTCFSLHQMNSAQIMNKKKLHAYLFWLLMTFQDYYDKCLFSQVKTLCHHK